MHETELLKIAATQGPWAVLFVALLFYTMRDAANRERLLMDFLGKLADSLRALTEKYDALYDDVCEIKQDVRVMVTRK